MAMLYQSTNSTYGVGFRFISVSEMSGCETLIWWKIYNICLGLWLESPKQCKICENLRNPKLGFLHRK
jgi:hypothetical protein